jgi:Flp pilus assembly protein TadG
VKRLNRAIHRERGQAGQSLVEFALVFPIFFTLLMALIEFGLVFNALLSVNFASRDASLTAAEAGNAAGSDCLILKKVEDSISAPSSTAKVTEVRIYKADKNGLQTGSQVDVWARSGSKTCTLPDGSTLTVPYSLTSGGYPEADRCNIQGGCPGLPGAPIAVDNIGVKITYHYTWFTPMGTFIGLGATDYTMVESNAMRMEPIL